MDLVTEAKGPGFECWIWRQKALEQETKMKYLDLVTEALGLGD